MKKFNQMTDSEKAVYAKSLCAYVDGRFRRVLSAQVFDKECNVIVEEGFSLMEAFHECTVFLNQRRRYRDYQRGIITMQRYLKIFKERVVPFLVTLPEKRHVGRPTRSEQEAYRQKHIADRVKQDGQSLFPTVFDPKDPSPIQTVTKLTYYGILADPNGENISATMPRLTDLLWFLPEPLKEEVQKIRSLRSDMASLAEQAKTEALANEKAGSAVFAESDIADKATRAQDIQTMLGRIYDDVDARMAEVYIRMKYDPHYVERVRKAWSTPVEQLCTSFRPFYDKVEKKQPGMKEKVLAMIASEDPVLGKKREEDAEKAKEVHGILKYLKRTDKKNTDKRIQGMKDRLQRLRELVGNEADVYCPLLEAAMADNQKLMHTKHAK